MKIIITESQYNTLTRRYVSPKPLEEMVEISLDFLDVKKFPNVNTFYSAVLAQTQSRILRDMLENNVISLGDLSEKNNLIKDIRKDISDYIFLNHFDEIYDYFYSKKQSKKKSNLDEVELTERCWKGYTQKGMKTMFGKKYPNCVKIKK